MDQIRERNIRFGVALKNDWKIAAAFYGAGVRYRVGPLGPFYSYLFYNRGVRQRRSRVEMHEADYNLQLLRRLGIRPFQNRKPAQVVLGKAVQSWAQEWLSQAGLPGSGWVAIHPGMGGSALNWPESHYAALADSLLDLGHSVLMTAGPSERVLVERVRGLMRNRAQSDQESQPGTAPAKLVIYHAAPESGVDHLGALLSCAGVVVAPSTGPLHLAVALGRPVVTFFPPVRVQSALRWGPYLPEESAQAGKADERPLGSRASVLVPDVYCGQDFRCRGDECRYCPCMQGLTIDSALEQVLKHLNHERAIAPKESPEWNI